MHRPSLKQLSYLIALDDEHSFIAAAEKCAVTQSTLSAGIKELENALDQQLVIRGRKKTTLTPFGLETVDRARRILEQTDNIVARSRLLKEPLSGPLRLGIIPTIAPYMLPDIIPRLTEKFPRLELQLHEDMTDRLLDALHMGKIDIALMAFPFDTPGMIQNILFEEPFYVAVGQQHEWASKDKTKIDMLEPEKLLLLEDGHCLTDHALGACALQAPRERKTFSATSLPTLIQMVRHHFGMTLLPEMACTPDTLAAGIHLIPFKDKKPPTRQIGLCWNQADPRRRDFDELAKVIGSIA